MLQHDINLATRHTWAPDGEAAAALTPHPPGCCRAEQAASLGTSRNIKPGKGLGMLLRQVTAPATSPICSISLVVSRDGGVFGDLNTAIAPWMLLMGARGFICSECFL